MYKEIIVCTLVVIFIISMDYISNNYTKRIFTDINLEMSNLREKMVNKEEAKDTKDQICKIEEIWKKHLKIISCYIEHNELEKVARQIAIIKGNIEIEEYSQAIPQLDDCVYIINHIMDKEKLLIQNLF